MIKGNILRDALLSGANNIVNCRQAVDELNVFPVPDGDTGTNMSMTISAAARELAQLDDDASAELVAKTNASALLRGARGNSGVILS
ncbi:MAG: DAK2 domain-containing protein, partial [Clostridia bacterium]|nr:DAK2 domain-containing protein [Clostridia bacterium]